MLDNLFRSLFEVVADELQSYRLVICIYQSKSV